MSFQKSRGELHALEYDNDDADHNRNASSCVLHQVEDEDEGSGKTLSPTGTGTDRGREVNSKTGNAVDSSSTENNAARGDHTASNDDVSSSARVAVPVEVPCATPPVAAIEALDFFEGEGCLMEGGTGGLPRRMSFSTRTKKEAADFVAMVLQGLNVDGEGQTDATTTTNISSNENNVDDVNRSHESHASNAKTTASEERRRVVVSAGNSTKKKRTSTINKSNEDQQGEGGEKERVGEGATTPRSSTDTKKRTDSSSTNATPRSKNSSSQNSAQQTANARTAGKGSNKPCPNKPQLGEEEASLSRSERPVTYASIRIPMPPPVVKKKGLARRKKKAASSPKKEVAVESVEEEPLLPQSTVVAASTIGLQHQEQQKESTRQQNETIGAPDPDEGDFVMMAYTSSPRSPAHHRRRHGGGREFKPLHKNKSSRQEEGKTNSRGDSSTGGGRVGATDTHNKSRSTSSPQTSSPTRRRRKGSHHNHQEHGEKESSTTRDIGSNTDDSYLKGTHHHDHHNDRDVGVGTEYDDKDGNGNLFTGDPKATTRAVVVFRQRNKKTGGGGAPLRAADEKKEDDEDDNALPIRTHHYHPPRKMELAFPTAEERHRAAHDLLTKRLGYDAMGSISSSTTTTEKKRKKKSVKEEGHDAVVPEGSDESADEGKRVENQSIPAPPPSNKKATRYYLYGEEESVEVGPDGKYRVRRALPQPFTFFNPSSAAATSGIGKMKRNRKKKKGKIEEGHSVNSTSDEESGSYDEEDPHGDNVMGSTGTDLNNNNNNNPTDNANDEKNTGERNRRQLLSIVNVQNTLFPSMPTPLSVRGGSGGGNPTSRRTGASSARTLRPFSSHPPYTSNTDHQCTPPSSATLLSAQKRAELVERTAARLERREAKREEAERIAQQMSEERAYWATKNAFERRQRAEERRIYLRELTALWAERTDRSPYWLDEVKVMGLHRWSRGGGRGVKKRRGDRKGTNTNSPSLHEGDENDAADDDGDSANEEEDEEDEEERKLIAYYAAKNKDNGEGKISHPFENEEDEDCHNGDEFNYYNNSSEDESEDGGLGRLRGQRVVARIRRRTIRGSRRPPPRSFPCTVGATYPEGDPYTVELVDGDGTHTVVTKVRRERREVSSQTNEIRFGDSDWFYLYQEEGSSCSEEDENAGAGANANGGGFDEGDEVEYEVEYVVAPDDENEIVDNRGVPARQNKQQQHHSKQHQQQNPQHNDHHNVHGHPPAAAPTTTKKSDKQVQNNGKKGGQTVVMRKEGEDKDGIMMQLLRVKGKDGCWRWVRFDGSNIPNTREDLRLYAMLERGLSAAEERTRAAADPRAYRRGRHAPSAVYVGRDTFKPPLIAAGTQRKGGDGETHPKDDAGQDASKNKGTLPTSSSYLQITGVARLSAAEERTKGDYEQRGAVLASSVSSEDDPERVERNNTIDDTTITTPVTTVSKGGKAKNATILNKSASPRLKGNAGIDIGGSALPLGDATHEYNKAVTLLSQRVENPHRLREGIVIRYVPKYRGAAFPTPTNTNTNKKQTTNANTNKESTAAAAAADSSYDERGSAANPRVAENGSAAAVDENRAGFRNANGEDEMSDEGRTAVGSTSSPSSGPVQAASTAMLVIPAKESASSYAAFDGTKGRRGGSATTASAAVLHGSLNRPRITKAYLVGIGERVGSGDGKVREDAPSVPAANPNPRYCVPSAAPLSLLPLLVGARESDKNKKQRSPKLSPSSSLLIKSPRGAPDPNAPPPRRRAEGGLGTTASAAAAGSNANKASFPQNVRAPAPPPPSTKPRLLPSSKASNQTNAHTTMTTTKPPSSSAPPPSSSAPPSSSLPSSYSSPQKHSPKKNGSAVKGNNTNNNSGASPTVAASKKKKATAKKLTKATENKKKEDGGEEGDAGVTLETNEKRERSVGDDRDEGDEDEAKRRTPSLPPVHSKPNSSGAATGHYLGEGHGRGKAAAPSPPFGASSSVAVAAHRSDSSTAPSSYLYNDMPTGISRPQSSSVRFGGSGLPPLPTTRPSVYVGHLDGAFSSEEEHGGGQGKGDGEDTEKIVVVGQEDEDEAYSYKYRYSMAGEEHYVHIGSGGGRQQEGSGSANRPEKEAAAPPVAMSQLITKYPFLVSSASASASPPSAARTKSETKKEKEERPSSGNAAATTTTKGSIRNSNSAVTGESPPSPQRRAASAAAAGTSPRRPPLPLAPHSSSSEVSHLSHDRHDDRGGAGSQEITPHQAQSSSEPLVATLPSAAGASSGSLVAIPPFIPPPSLQEGVMRRRRQSQQSAFGGGSASSLPPSPQRSPSPQRGPTGFIAVVAGASGDNDLAIGSNSNSNKKDAAERPLDVSSHANNRGGSSNDSASRRRGSSSSAVPDLLLSDPIMRGTPTTTGVEDVAADGELTAGQLLRQITIEREKAEAAKAQRAREQEEALAALRAEVESSVSVLAGVAAGAGDKQSGQNDFKPSAATKEPLNLPKANAVEYDQNLKPQRSGLKPSPPVTNTPTLLTATTDDDNATVAPLVNDASLSKDEARNARVSSASSQSRVRFSALTVSAMEPLHEEKQKEAEKKDENYGSKREEDAVEHHEEEKDTPATTMSTTSSNYFPELPPTLREGYSVAPPAGDGGGARRGSRRGMAGSGSFNVSHRVFTPIQMLEQDLSYEQKIAAELATLREQRIKAAEEKEEDEL